MLSNGHIVYAFRRAAWELQVSANSTLAMTLPTLMGFGQLGGNALVPMQSMTAFSFRTLYKA